MPPSPLHDVRAAASGTTTTAATAGPNPLEDIENLRELEASLSGPDGGGGDYRESPSPTERSRVVALDCEMVGAGPGGFRSIAARVCVVDWDGNVLLDAHVRPTEPVTDYRTFVSGVRREDLTSEGGALDADECRRRVSALLRGRVLVGHALKNDLMALGIGHPWYDIRDTAKYAPYMAVVPPAVSAVPAHVPANGASAAVKTGPERLNPSALSSPVTPSDACPSSVESDCSSSTSSASSAPASESGGGTGASGDADAPQHHPSPPPHAHKMSASAKPWEPPTIRLRPRKLRELAMERLSLDIQRPGDEHNPAEDARAAMGLYRLARHHWERVVLHKVRRTRAIQQGGSMEY